MLQDNKLKIAWDVCIMLVLLIVTVIIPYRLAFVIEDDMAWKVLYYFFDVMFALDIVFCFLTSYTDKYNKIEVTDIKLIAN